MQLKRKSVIYGICVALGALFAAILVARVFFGYDIFDRSGWDRGEDGTCRYLDYHGDPLTGWQEIEGNTYYFSPEQEGIMATGWLGVEEDRYFLGEDGLKTTGWATLDGETYRQYSL